MSLVLGYVCLSFVHSIALDIGLHHLTIGMNMGMNDLGIA